MGESIKAMEEKIKGYRCNRKAGYVFISYSHKDANLVFPQVLNWLESGYNIYIDTDFEQHGSDENWVGIMRDVLASTECKMAICFKSENYLYSYAALIELLTMRMKKVARRRGAIQGQNLPIDIISIGVGNGNSDFSSNEVKKEYQGYFDKLKGNMGATFADKNKPEYDMLKEGLEDWIENLTPDKKSEADGTAEERLEVIVETYKASASEGGSSSDFYIGIATTMLLWFKTMDLNGNTKSLESVFDSRFADLKVYKSEAVIKALDEAAPAVKDGLPTEGTVPVVAVENLNVAREKSGNKPEAAGKIAFTLYGKEYSGNQSDLLFFTFYEVLKRHAELIEAVTQSFTCASTIDYTVQQNRTDTMPSYFRVCEHFTIGEKRVCIGAAYGLKDKLKLVAKLLVLAGEPYDVLKIEGIELPVIKERGNAQALSSRGDNAPDFEYCVFGQIMRGNQSTMMWDFYQKLMEIYPDKAEDLTQLLAVARQDDVTSPNTKEATPSYFRGCRLFQVNGEGYYVGTSFGKDAKYAQIRKMIEICHAPEDSFSMEYMEVVEKEKRKRVFD